MYGIPKVRNPFLNFINFIVLRPCKCPACKELQGRMCTEFQVYVYGIPNPCVQNSNFMCTEFHVENGYVYKIPRRKGLPHAYCYLLVLQLLTGGLKQPVVQAMCTGKTRNHGIPYTFRAWNHACFLTGIPVAKPVKSGIFMEFCTHSACLSFRNANLGILYTLQEPESLCTLEGHKVHKGDMGN